MKTQTIALITGASSGMGKATAKQLLKDGYRVYAAARRLDKMADLKQLGAIPIQLDVTNGDQVQRAIAQIEQQAGGVDVLINNAGFGLYGAVEDTSLEDARDQFEVNLFAMAELTRAVLPHMRRQGAGKIVNLSSMGGKIYTPLGAWYHASKHAVEGWSDCLRLELAPFGIDVIIIEPGLIDTDFGSTLLQPMLQRSDSGAYAELARSVAAATDKTYQTGQATPPVVVARTISRALRARRPKTRYAVGKLARPLLLIRKWFGDRLFDKVVMSQL